MRFLKSVCGLALALLLAGCAAQGEPADIAATTAPVAQFTRAIAAGSGLTVAQVINDNVSCLHDYSLSVRQMEVLTQSRAVLISGAGLEETMEDVLAAAETVYDCAEGVPLLEPDGHFHDEEAHEHEHEHEHEHDHGHAHEHDPHIWLSPANAAMMAENIRAALTALYPEQADLFQANAEALTARLADLQAYGETALADLGCRELITFHDGFGYLADAFGLEIAAAMEEEAGSEAAAADLIAIIDLIEAHRIPAVFTEVNGSVSAAAIIQAEIGTPSYTLDMAMSSDYFEAMTHNIDTLKEALP